MNTDIRQKTGSKWNLAPDQGYLLKKEKKD